jgi:hypothetical protein
MYESIRRRGEQNAATPRGVARRFGKQCPRLHVARCLSNAARRNAWCTQDGPDLNELEQLVRVDVVKHAVHHAQRTVLAHLRGCVHQQGDLASGALSVHSATVAQPQIGGIACASLSTMDRKFGRSSHATSTPYSIRCNVQRARFTCASLSRKPGVAMQPGHSRMPHWISMSAAHPTATTTAPGPQHTDAEQR